MKVHIANLINSSVLIIIGLSGYFLSESPSFTAFIPVIAGAILIAFTKGMKNHNKLIAHIVVTITLLVLIALLKPLFGAIERNDSSAIIRVLLMIMTSLYAMIAYIKSFIDARKSNTAQ